MGFPAYGYLNQRRDYAEEARMEADYRERINSAVTEGYGLYVSFPLISGTLSGILIGGTCAILGAPVLIPSAIAAIGMASLLSLSTLPEVMEVRRLRAARE